MVIGFTGTRRGMTGEQLRTVRRIFAELPLDTLHHGVCEGCDAQAHHEARRLGARVEGHPPRGGGIGRMAVLLDCDVLHPPKPYLVRDRNIVVAGRDGLVACPRQMQEPASKRGEGTWTTVGYARKAKRHIWIVLPDGTVREEQ